MSVKLAPDALAIDGLEAGHLFRLDGFVPCLCQNRLRQGMLRMLLQASGQGQQPVFVAIDCVRAGDRRMPFGDGAGLVENHQIQLAGCLQRIPLADQGTVFSGLTDTDHHRHWRRQTQCTGAGDNQYRGGRHHHVHHRRFRPDVVPDQRRKDRNDHHCGYEHRRDLVRQTPDGGFGTLGFFYQPDDLRQGRLTADPGGFVDDRAVSVQRACGHLVPLGLAHRHRFTGQHALVHPAAALADEAIDRNLLAGTDPDPVALAHLFHRDVLLLTVPDHPGGLRPQIQQPAHRLRSLAFGAQLQCLTQVDQTDDHRRCLEIHMPGHFRQQLRHTGHDDGIQPGGTGADGNQGIHIGVVMPERLPGPGVKVPAGGGHDNDRQHPEPQPGSLVRLGHHHRPEPHAPDHQTQPQGQTHRHLDQQGAVLLAILRLLALIGLVGVLDHTGAIAGALDGLDQCIRVRIPGGRRGVVCQVHVGVGNPGYRHHRLLDGIHTGGAGGTADRQTDLVSPGRRLGDTLIRLF